MAKIYEDEVGLYAKVGGYIVRPVDGTQFKKGDTTEGFHFRGSTLIGMGKIAGRGEYKEYWRTPSYFYGEQYVMNPWATSPPKF